MINLVLVGIGGIGQTILAKSFSKLKPFYDQGYVQYIAIDTGKHDTPLSIDRFYAPCDSGDVNGLLEGAYAPIVKNWWFENYKPAYNFSNGAYQFGLLGKGAFFWNADQIYTRFNTAMDQFTRGNEFLFIVVGSSAGGTCRGIFREIPSVIKSINKVGSTSKLVGILLDHTILDAFVKESKKDLAKRNSHSLYLEIESSLISTTVDSRFDIVTDIITDPANKRKTSIKNGYEYIFLTGLNNTDGNYMDSLDDYYELATSNIESLYMITSSYNTKAKGTMKSIENFYSGLIAEKVIPVKFSINDESTKYWSTPFYYGRTYCAYNDLSVVFPNEKAVEYLTNEFSKIQIEEFLTDNEKKETRESIISSLIAPFKETKHQDTIIEKAQQVFGEIAESEGENYLGGIKLSIISIIKARLLDPTTDPSSYVASLEERIKRLSSGEKFRNSFNAFLLATKKQFDQSLIIKMNESGKSLEAKIKTLDALIEALIFEQNDFTEQINKITEEKNLDQIALDIKTHYVSSSDIKKTGWFAYFTSIIDSFIHAFVQNKISNIKNEKTADKIASKLVDNYLIYAIYFNIYPLVTRFYEDIKNEIVSIKSQLDDLKKKISEYKKDTLDKSSFKDLCIEPIRFPPPNKLDLVLRLAYDSEILNERLFFPNKDLVIGKYETELFKYIFLDKEIQTEQSSPDIISKIKSISESVALEIVGNVTLDHALEWEIMYFFKHFLIKSPIRTLNKVYSGIQSVINEASGDEKKVILLELANYFEDKILNLVLFNEEKHTESELIEFLKEARILLFMETWKNVFIETKERVPYLEKSYTEYYSLIGIKTQNPQFYNLLIKKIFPTVIQEKVTEISGYSNSKISFNRFLIGTTLAEIKTFENSFQDIKDNYENNTKTYLLNPKSFTNPNASGLLFSDKRFVSNSTLLSYATFFDLNVPNPSIFEKFINLILLLKATDVIRQTRSNIIFNERLTTYDGETCLQKDFTIKDYSELYRILYRFYFKDIDSLLKNYKSVLNKKIKSSSSKKISAKNLLEDTYEKLMNNNKIDFNMLVNTMASKVQDFIKSFN